MTLTGFRVPLPSKREASMRPRGLPADDEALDTPDIGERSSSCFNEAAGTTRG